MGERRTFADEGVVQGRDKIALELIAVVGGRHRIGACVNAAGLESGREALRAGRAFHHFSVCYSFINNPPVHCQ